MTKMSSNVNERVFKNRVSGGHNHSATLPYDHGDKLVKVEG